MTLNEFIAKNNLRTKEKSKITNTSIGGYTKGSFHVPDELYDEFLKVYCDTLRDKNNVLCFTEKHKEVSPIVIDLDFRSESSTRLYTQAFVCEFVEKLIEIVYRYVVIERVTDVYVLEKPAPRKATDKRFKDGIHIMIPTIVTTPQYQHAIRKEFLQSHPHFFKDVSNTTCYEVYDEAVIERNNWMMYGSQKPDEKYPWNLTYIIEVDENCRVARQNKVPNSTDLLTAVRHLSIRLCYEEADYKKDLTELDAPPTPFLDESRSIVSNISQISTETKVFTSTPPCDIQFIKELINALDKKRANDYNSWMNVGWCLYNIGNGNEEYLDIWIQFSKRSYKYKDGECDNKWDVMQVRENGYIIGSLILWAREDNPDLAQTIEDKYRVIHLDNNNLTVTELRTSRKAYSYQFVKEVFERSHFKLEHPSMFVAIVRNKIYICNKADFETTYLNLYYYKYVKDVGYEKKNFFKDWCHDGNCRTYVAMDFYPQPLVCPNDIYNLWKGFAIDNVNDVQSSHNVEPFINHMSSLVNHNKSHLDYFVKWLAQLVQQPGTLNGIALVFVSKEGVGKNLFLQKFMDIIGKEFYFETSNPQQHLFSRFANGRLNKLLIDIDEAKAKDTFSLSEELKNMITSPMFNYERKGVNMVEVNNFARIVFTTNNDNAVKITADSRRYVVFECSPENIGNSPYFKGFVQYMENQSNQKAIIEYLRNIDISQVNWILDRPMSDAYVVMKQQGACLVLKYFEHIYLESLHDSTEAIEIQAIELLNGFKKFLKTEMSLKEEVVNAWNKTSFGRKVSVYIKDNPKTISKQDNVGPNRCLFYFFNKQSLETMLKTNGLLTSISYMFIDPPDNVDRID